MAVIVSASTALGQDERGARDFIIRFYTQQASAEPAPFDAYWAPEATDRAVQLHTHRRLHVLAGNIAVRDLVLEGVTVDGAKARAEATYFLSGSPAREGDALSGFGLRRRIVECVQRDGQWLVMREYAAEELLGDLVEAAPIDDRMRVVREHPGWVPRDLVFVLLNRAMRDMRRGQAPRGVALADLARTIADEAGDPDGRARANETLGILAAASGDANRAIALNDAAQAIPGVSPDTRAVVLNTRGTFHMQRAEFDLARAAYTAALAIRDEARIGRLNAPVVGNLASVAQQRSDYEGASRLYRESMAMAEAVGDQRVVSNILSNLGAVEHERGNYREAQALYQRVLGRATAADERDLIATALNNIGLVHRLQGQLDLARDYLTRSLSMREASGDKARVASTLQNLGMVERLDGDGAKAADYFARSLAIREQLGDQTGLALIYNTIGMVADAERRHEDALAAYGKSLEIAERIGNRSRMVQALANIAITERARGALDRAAAAAERAIEICRQIGNREQLLSGLTTLGQVLADQGRPDRARQVLDDAISVVEGMREDAGASAQEQQRFFESRTSPYEALVALRLGGKDAWGALAAAERAKARVLLDVLQRGRVTLAGAMTTDERTREAALADAITTPEHRVATRAVDGRARRCARVGDRDAAATGAGRLRRLRGAALCAVSQPEDPARPGAGVHRGGRRSPHPRRHDGGDRVHGDPRGHARVRVVARRGGEGCGGASHRVRRDLARRARRARCAGGGVPRSSRVSRPSGA